MTTNFITLFEDRTGSSYFMDCLNSVPYIRAEPEVMHRLPDQSEQPRWIDQFYSEPRPDLSARGYKAKLRDVYCEKTLRELLTKHRCRVIYMTRTNIVKLIVSGANGRRRFETSGDWNRLEHAPPLPPFYLPLDYFNRLLKFRMERERLLKEFVESLPLPVMTIRYEDLLASPESVFGATFAFLGVPSAPVTSKYLKNTDDDLSKVVLNLAELRAFFAGTELEPMFD